MKTYYKIYEDGNELDFIRFNNKCIPKSNDNKDYIKFLDEIDKEMATLEEPIEKELTYNQQRMAAYKETFGGTTAMHHLEYIYQNNITQWKQAITAIRDLYPEPEE